MKILCTLFLFLFLLSCDRGVSEYQTAGLSTVDQQVSDAARREGAKIIFRSNDGGQTWVDISEGLPEDLGDDFTRQIFSAKDSGIYLRTGDGWYHSEPGSTAPYWEKENFSQPLNQEIINWVESNGVRLTSTRKGVMRSADGGKNWELVISEGGVIAIQKIEGGFAAITHNTLSNTRRVRISSDGKNWEAIDAGLPSSAFVASIIQVDQYFLCGHPSGIFKSPDRGRTWSLVLPAVDDKVFRLSASGNVIYATSRFGGC
jgi:photosystem II stability/assembly factor-like uncharacterized protein